MYGLIREREVYLDLFQGQVVEINDRRETVPIF